MSHEIQRRQFLQISAAGTAMALGAANLVRASADSPPLTRLISPGCRRTKVKVARIYVAGARTDWPRPGLDLQAEVRSYQPVFDQLKDELADVEFTVDRLITSPKEVESIQEELKKADGVLVIQLGIGIHDILVKILEAGKPTVAFAIPYSGHDWASWGWLMKQPVGARLDCHLDQRSQAIGGRDPAHPGDPPSPRGQDFGRDGAAPRRVRPANEGEVRHRDQAGGPEGRGSGLQRRRRRPGPGRNRPLDSRRRRRSSSRTKENISSRAGRPWPSRRCWPTRTPRC